MFGYVRPYVPELRVRENELYRAIYCGLCREMGRITGQMSRLSLNYDLAFLAAVRILLTADTVESKDLRCVAHPLKKHSILCGGEALAYSAAVSALLVSGKVDDNVRDEKGFGKIAALSLRPSCRRMAEKAKRYLGEPETICGAVHDGLDTLSEFETAGENSIDRCADSFGEMMAEIFAAGLDEKSARIAREIGYGTGRFVYVADAIDDAAEDAKCGRFNPIIAFYGEDATEKTDGKTYLRRDIAEELMCATLVGLERTASAAELICDGGDPGVAAVVRNIIYLGMPEMMKSIIKRRTRGTAQTKITEGKADQ